MDKRFHGTYIETGALEAFAASCARLNAPQDSTRGSVCCRMLRGWCRQIEALQTLLDSRYAHSAAVPTACRWIMDNGYLVKREASAALPGLRSAELRSCRDGVMALELCRALVSSGEGKLTEERCGLFLSGFQSVTALSRSEMAALPQLLRCAVIERIASECRAMRGESDTDSRAALLSALFSSLRLISELDWETLLDSWDVTGRILSRDPTGEYANMDSATRQEYLRRVEKLARRAGISQPDMAEQLIIAARQEGRHVGCLLFPERGRTGSRLYICANVLLTGFFSLLPAFVTGSPAAAVLLFLPVWELTKSLIDYVLLLIIRPRPVLRMDMSKGVPPDSRTLCVISTILDSKCVSRLRELRLASLAEGRELLFGVLADLPPEKTPECDYDKALTASARRETAALNREFGGGFYLFTRPRRFDGDGFSGHERKRGAILELCKLICDKPSELSVTGELDMLHSVRYIITLDSDTVIYPGALGELIGAASHPLCKPIINSRTNTVTAGHAILHPRIETELESASATDFALIFAPSGGSDPYGSLCSELYMDAFDNGGFAGKGIIDPRALLQCTGERFPQGRILSHDALEGAYLRGGYVGDTSFSDRFPARPLPYFKRQHRWVRGDWQNSPWLFHRELTPLDRFRLFDSLRRSLVPAATLAAIVFGFMSTSPGIRLAGWAALLSLVTGIVFSLLSRLKNRRSSRGLRRHTRLLNGLGGAIVSCFLRLWLLPYECYVNLSAIILALWRMLISKRHLLQWQTAAQCDRGDSTLAAHIRSMWFSVMLGVLLMGFSPDVGGKASGFMWLLSPAAAWAMSLPAFRPDMLSAANREQLLDYAGASWQYLERYSSKEDNYLPPDNFQEQPPVGTAHRTSPTNMGLAMAAATACADMEIITRAQACAYIRRMADTMDRLYRFEGHFCNWYDTRTLRPLSPVYVSTVDSGNLYAGLLAACRAAEEWGDTELAARLRAFLEPMDFAPLYDRQRGLFYICRDTVTGECRGGRYDLMASEAMLTSYIAICRGDVPVKHWRRLSRAQLQKDGYRGLASWTGTMFEYLMPFLFLPVYRSSLLYESGIFCLYAQKKRVPADVPWGISESAFASPDSALSYRYKAHGCADLALKRGQDEELVISPYSSFLALCLDPNGSVNNLRRLEKHGMLGSMGFYEALDFTAGRCRSASGERVRCVMAHHVSMSIIAAGNALCPHTVRDRFITEPMMSARKLLLQERLPEGGEFIRRTRSQQPEKPPRTRYEIWSSHGSSEDSRSCCVLSNGVYNIMSTSTGENSALYQGKAIYRGGIDIALDGERIFPGTGPIRWEFSESRVSYSLGAEGSELSVTISPADTEAGELRLVDIMSNIQGRHVLSFSFSPMLCALRDYRSHPAYWQLGIEAHEADDIFYLRRLPRQPGGELWLAVGCSHRAMYDHINDTVTVSVPVDMRKGEKEHISLALCAGTEAPSADSIRQILSQGDIPGFSMVSAAALRMGMGPDDISRAMDMLSAVSENALREACPKTELWRFGISGDLPIIMCRGDARERLAVLRRFCLLLSCGVECELCYITDEAGEYLQPMTKEISDELTSLGLDSLMGAHGGVFFVPSQSEGLIRSRAACIISEEKQSHSLPVPVLGHKRAPRTAPDHAWDGSVFKYYVNSNLPARCWQHVLTNGSFGYIASDCGMGNMWYRNAREMRINTPPENIRALSGPEYACVCRSGESISLFAANDGHRCTVSFSPGCARWEKDIDGRTVRTAVFIPAGIDARVLILSGAEGLRLKWGTTLALSGGDGAGVVIQEDGSRLRCRSSESYYPGLSLSIGLSGPGIWEYGYSPAAVSLEAVMEETSVLVIGCCSDGELAELCKPDFAELLLSDTENRWTALCSRLRTETPCVPLDDYLSPWSVYQCIACRLQGRSSLYQSGGAIGFRDQLQDSMNMLLISPHYARTQILDCCRHQYTHGDVMHWWHPHPDGDKGVRTRCSDDLLWLVWALCDYVNLTGDIGICDEEAVYLASRPLSQEERDRYETPAPSRSSGTVLDHARRALDCCISRGFGPHGLPYMGSGDWNDAFDRVQGESVWLGWFLSMCAHSFASLLDRLGRAGGQEYRRIAETVGHAADGCFNGRWYVRAYYPDGEAIGDGDRLDSLAQSFAAMSPYASPEKAEKALSAAFGRLVDRTHGLVKLFDPPFSPEERSPGYVTAYGAGRRENGGQYTHGAIWLAIALIKTGRTEEGWEILKMLLPTGRDAGIYEAEPFVLPADISSAPGAEGQAGWTWYTGSAGWYFRAVTEYIFGMKLRDGRLTLSPALPAELQGSRVRWTDSSGREHEIFYGRDGITVDGAKYDGREI